MMARLPGNGASESGGWVILIASFPEKLRPAALVQFCSA